MVVCGKPPVGRGVGDTVMNPGQRRFRKGTGRRGLAVGVAAVLLAGLFQPVVSAAPFFVPPANPDRPVPQSYPPVPVNAVAEQALPDLSTGPGAAQSIRIPAGEVTVTVPPASEDLAAASSFERAGDTGIELAATPSDEATGTTAPSPAPDAGGDAEVPVTVQVLDAAAAMAAGAPGLALKLTAPQPVDVTVKVPDNLVDDIIGGDFDSRVVWSVAPTEAAGSAEPVATEDATTSEEAGSLAATQVHTQATPTGVTLLALSGTTASDGSGSFGATSLALSSSWTSSGNTGGFTWSYPVTVPPAPAGPAPAFSLDYDSGSVDGRTGSTNNQVSVLGEGWNLSGGGFIERSYAACSQDGQSGSGDLCWSTDNATVSFGGHSGTLVKDSSGTWRLQTDDGTKVEKLTGATNGDNDGEYWKITTPDGVQYFFGRNRLPGWVTGKTETASTWTVPVFGNNTGEPCKAATFATSSCAQAWRWNLDHVIDPHGNAEAFYYEKQQNAYLLNGATKTTYDMGGVLTRVDYAMRTGAEYTTTAPARVVFDKADRCEFTTNCTQSNTANWPDVPWDLYCLTTACTGKTSPSFFTTLKLGAIRTQIYKGSAYVDVDKWALTHTFPATGDGTSRSLWLSSIARTGYDGAATATVPPVSFGGTALQNRVWANGLAPLMKYRINAITLETGATIAVSYSAQECSPSNLPAAPETNSKRCFPQRWIPPLPAPQTEQLDYFHKYVVTAVSVNPGPNSGSPVETTSYDYLGTPAWRYSKAPTIPADKRTWSIYAGYAQVKTRHGDPGTPSQQETSVTTYFRGLNGDRLNAAGGTRSVSVTASDASTFADHLWLAGRPRETTSYLGDTSTRIANTIYTPWVSPAIGTDGTNEVRRVGDTEETTRTALAAGGNLTTTVKTTNDTLGRPTAVNDLGDTSITTDDRCTRTTYVDNTTLNLRSTPSRTTVTGIACTATAVLPADAISDTKLFYDGSSTFGSVPTRGLVTRTDIAASYTGTTPNYQTVSTGTFDALGRPLTTVDPRITPSRTTSTVYTPATGLTTTTVATNPLGWNTTVVVDPARGSVLSSKDPNNRVTEGTYDALGRQTQVWNPNWPRTANPTTPSASYSYSISNTAPSWTASTTLTAAGSYATNYQIFDGLFRVRQTQGVQNSGDARVVTDITYDAAGRKNATNDLYNATGAPSGTLVLPTVSVPSGTVTQYDGAGRVTAEVKLGNGVEMWRTSSIYGGNSVTTTPPAGGTPTTTVINARGKTSLIKQYLAATPTGTTHDTSYTYDHADRLTSMTDAQGNKWTWTFDVLGRQVTAVDPDAGSTINTYDAAGRIATSKDARNQVLAFTYDALDRPTGRYNTSTTGTLLASWTYDTATGGKGQLASSTRYVGATDQYISRVTGYDELYKPTGQQLVIPAGAGAVAGTYTFGMTYAPDGSPLTRSLPAMGGLPTEELTYGYDGLGRVAGLTSDRATYLSGVYYTELGEIAQTMRYAANFELYQIFYRTAATQRLSSKQTLLFNYGTAANVNIDTHDYTYNAAGLVTADRGTSDGLAADQQCYRYDYKQQLTDAWTPNAADCSAAPGAAGYAGPAPYRSAFTYSPSGNRTQSTGYALTGTNHQVRKYTYPTPGATTVRPHAVTSVTITGPNAGTSNFSYDAAGHTTSQNGRTLTYDAEGRLASVTNGSVVDNRIYDADGNLLLITGSSGKQLFLGETILTVPAGGTVVSASRVYTVAGLQLAERTTTNGTSNTRTYLDANTQGTVSARITTTGVITRQYSLPYGSTRAPTTTWTGKRGFLNQPFNTASGLTHLGARDYDPSNGRFTTVDPIFAPINPAQNNGYNYGANNPVNNTEPDRHCSCNAANIADDSRCGDSKANGDGLNAAGTRNPTPTLLDAPETGIYNPLAPVLKAHIC